MKMAKVVDHKDDPEIHGPFFGVAKGAISWNMPSRTRQPPASKVPVQQYSPPLGVDPIMQIVEALMEGERRRGQ